MFVPPAPRVVYTAPPPRLVSVGAKAAGTKTEKQSKALHTVAAWQSTQDTEAVSLADAPPDQRFGITWRLLLQLLDLDTSPQAVREAIYARRRRAKYRWMGLHSLRAVVQACSLSSVQREAVVQLSPALCDTASDASRGVAPSLFKGLAACGDDVRSAVRCVSGSRVMSIFWCCVRQNPTCRVPCAAPTHCYAVPTTRNAFQRLYATLVSFVKPESGRGAPLVQAALHSFALAYTAEDYR